MTATAAPVHARSHAFHPQALRAARRAAGLSLMAAAPLVDRHASVLARYERGEVDPDVGVLVAMATAYGVHPGAFFGPDTMHAIAMPCCSTSHHP